MPRTLGLWIAFTGYPDGMFGMVAALIVEEK
jgi:hypothetical protein